MSYSFQALHYIFFVHTNNSCCNSFFPWLNNQNESQAYDFSKAQFNLLRHYMIITLKKRIFRNYEVYVVISNDEPD